MTPIPEPVKNVTVWPWINWPPHHGIGPVIQPVIEDAAGTYSVGTLVTDIFYNLDLNSATAKYPLQLGGRYHASATTESGHVFNTPWMYCTNASGNPRFGRTIHHEPGEASDAGQPDERVTTHAPAVNPDQLIPLAALENVTVSQRFRPPAVGSLGLIENARGELVATKTGTPHLMGFTVSGGHRSRQLAVGMRRIAVTGRRVDNGDLVSFNHLTCENAGEPAVFLQTFP